MEAASLIVAREGSVARVILNRPAVHNPINLELVDALDDAFTGLRPDARVRAVTIEGAGPSFSAGADLKYFLSMVEDGPKLTHYIHRIGETFNAIEAFPKPVLAIVRGFCLAGGLELMLACDFSLAADDAQIVDQHANFGLFPGGGASQRLPRLIGERKAKERMFLGSRMSGREAERLGLVNRAVPAAELDGVIREWTSRLVEKSPTGLAYMKEAVRLSASVAPEAGIALEAARFLEYARLPDLKEGLVAFPAKRKPVF
jgi:enoyl-CoA hydratase/carnithine racemase